jgi:ParB family chromosome partitioning protein
MSHLAGFVEELEMSHISPPRYPLRHNLDSIPELAMSIEENGLLHPITVRVVGDRFEIIAGHRRYLACRRLKWARIPCQVVEADDKEAFELALTENIQHETLSPLDMARAFKSYVNEFGYGGESELARRIGRSEQYVSQYLQLLKLSPSVLRKLTTRVVSPSQARELIGLSAENQQTVADMIQKENLTSRQVRSIAMELRQVTGQTDSPFSARFAPSESEIRINQTQKTLGKCLASLRICMLKFDELIKQTDDEEWILKEVLIEHRSSLNRQIDSLIRLRKRLLRTLS